MSLTESRNLARLLGPSLLLVGASMLLNQGGFEVLAQDFMTNPSLLYLASVVGVVTGLALVLAHNIWTLNWRIVPGWIHR